MSTAGFVIALWLALDSSPAAIQMARDSQDRNALQQIAAALTAEAVKQPGNADAQYRAAVAQSTLAEVAQELRDKNQARSASEAGMRVGERAVDLGMDKAEFHRINGTLCGQAAAAVGGLGALKFGRCALEEVEKAVKLDPKAAVNYISRGVGYYYLPAALGGGVDLAIQDFKKAIALDTKSADAYLWLGVALRKASRNAEARQAFQKSVALNPARLWASQQLEKTPVQ